MRVGRPDHSEFIGVDAEFLFDFQTVPKSRTGIFELKHVIRLQHAEVEIALVPLFIAGEFVVRRKKGMRLAISLDLRYLVDSLPERARLRVLAIDWLASEGLNEREHSSVAKVAVVSESQHLAASFLLVLSHPLPEVARIVAALRLLCRVRFDHARFVTVIAKEDIAVQVVATGI